MKRTTKVLASVSALALVAGACGSDDDEGSADTTASTEAAATDDTAATDDATADEPADEPAGDEVTLRWRTRPDNDAEAQLYAEVSDTIAASAPFALEYEPGGTETSAYQDQLITEIGNGTAPDVFWIPGTDIARFQSEGLLLDLGPQAAEAGFDTSAFYPEPMFHLTFDPATGEPSDEVLWGLPRDVSTFALYLNLDLIAEAGAEDPRVLAEEGDWNWETFEEVAAAVTETGGANKGFGMNGWWANYGAFMNAAGGGFFTEDRTACALDTPESIAGLAQAQAIYDAGLAVPYGEDSEPPWKAGTVGMFINGRWATPGARADAAFNWDVVELPMGPSGSQGNWLFWGAYVVNANTEHPEEAFALVQELTTAETQAAISELGANIPSRQSQEAVDAFLTFTPPENNQAFINALTDNPTAEGPLWTGSWPAYDEAMNNAVTSVLTGERTIDDYQANVCNEVSIAFE